jgi:hypothetical protein
MTTYGSLPYGTYEAVNPGLVQLSEFKQSFSDTTAQDAAKVVVSTGTTAFSETVPWADLRSPFVSLESGILRYVIMAPSNSWARIKVRWEGRVYLPNFLVSEFPLIDDLDVAWEIHPGLDLPKNKAFLGDIQHKILRVNFATQLTGWVEQNKPISFSGDWLIPVNSLEADEGVPRIDLASTDQKNRYGFYLQLVSHNYLPVDVELIPEAITGSVEIFQNMRGIEGFHKTD